MKNIRWMIVGLVALSTRVSAVEFSLRDAVYKTDAELFAQGDFNTDGRLDIAVIQRDSGVVRVGYRQFNGGYTWAAPVASGVLDVSHATVGRMNDSATDRLVLSSITEQRIQWLDLESPGESPDLVTIPPQHLGPGQIVALDIDGANNDPNLDDLAVLTVLDSPPDDGHLTFMRLDANGSFTQSLFDGASPANDFNFLYRVRLRDGLKPTVALLNSAPALCLLYDVTSPPLYDSGNFLTGLSNNMRLLNARWNRGIDEYQFMFYEPGSSNITVSTLSASFAFQPPVDFSLPHRYGQHFLLEIGPAEGLGFVAVRIDRTAAHVFQFDGVNPPVPLSTIAAEPDQLITAVLAGDAGAFEIFQGPGFDQASEQSTPYTWDGSQFVAGSASTLAEPTTAKTGAHVFYFDGEPFVNDAANLITKRSQPDWTRFFFIVENAPSNSVRVLTSQGGDIGLVEQGVQILPLPPGSMHGWGNQLRADVSVIDRDETLGDIAGHVTIQPPAGSYERRFNITFDVSPGIDTVFRRFDPNDPWAETFTFAGGLRRLSPPDLLEPFDIYYYGVGPAGTTKTYQAHYEWIGDPQDRDSDGDSIPDFVEAEANLDPNGGSDSDEDGFSDLEELIAGSNPIISTSIPADRGQIAFQQTFSLAITPQSHNGSLTSLVYAPSFSEITFSMVAGLPTLVRTHTPDGEFLGSALTRDVPSNPFADPVATIDRLPAAPADSFVVVSTPRNFDTDIRAVPFGSGRELLGIVPMPDPAFPEVNYVYGGGAADVEAANWLDAARDAYTNTPPPLVADEHFDLYDSLHFVLVEKIIGDFLFARGNITSNRVTLAPNRSGEYYVDVSTNLPPERARIRITQDLLLGLQDQVLLHEIINTVRDGLDSNSANRIVQLKRLAEDLYRISANAEPDDFDVISPVAALREFVASGTLPAVYASDIVLDSSDRIAAFQACALIESAITPRELVEIEVEVVANSLLLECPKVLASADGSLLQLIYADGSSYPLPTTFPVPLHSRLRVSGYMDRPGPCAGPALEVVDISLIELPRPNDWADANGNLLPDEWEEAVLGAQQVSSLSDHDNDGYSDLHEYLAGTEPLNVHDRPIEDPLDLAPPSIRIERASGGLCLRWNYPDRYRTRVRFQMTRAEDPSTLANFVDDPMAVNYTDTDTWEVPLPNPSSNSRIYAFRMLLVE